MQQGLHRKENLVLRYFHGWLTSFKPENKDNATITVRKEGWMEVVSSHKSVPPHGTSASYSLIRPTYGDKLGCPHHSLLLPWGFQASCHGYIVFLKVSFLALGVKPTLLCQVSGALPVGSLHIQPSSVCRATSPCKRQVG